MTETLTAPPAQDPAVEKRTFSPSRLKLWMQCPLAWWFKYVHEVPEPPRDDALRGTLVHAVLERLFDVDPELRTPEYAESLFGPEFDRMCEDRGEASQRVKGLKPTELAAFREETITLTRPLLSRYFLLEHPGRFTPKWREVEVFGDIPGTNIRLKGFIDRVDELQGARKIVDYKGLAVDTPIPTPTGWTTMGALREGDEVFGGDGRPCRVIGKSQTRHRPCYRVTFDDKTSVVADDEHLWDVEGDGGRSVVMTQDLPGKLFGRKGQRHLRIPYPEKGLDLPDRALPLDPYVLGAWLGDGSAASGVLTKPLPELFAEIERRGYRVGPDISGHGKDSRTVYGIRGLLVDLGVLNDKHVPALYMRSSRQQRLDLLRGIMDTDGHWNATRKRCVVNTTSERFAAEVYELAVSLGWGARTFPVQARGFGKTVQAYQTWFTPLDEDVFIARLPETYSASPGARSRQRIIHSVEEIDSVPTECIAVDSPDFTYLCGRQMVRTHNSSKPTAPMFWGGWEFQIKVYALAMWLSQGVRPVRGEILALGYRPANARYREPEQHGQVAVFPLTEQGLRATAEQVKSIVREIMAAEEAAEERGQWPEAKPSKLCDWCPFQKLCPAQGGTLPEGPVPPKPVEDVAPSDPWATPTS